jgi:uridine kinase
MENCPIRQIIKRDGTVVLYDRDRIDSAIFKAAASVGETARARAEELGRTVERRLCETYGDSSVPTVEDIQDMVESVLIEARETKTAKAYIVYRHERAMARHGRREDVEFSDNIPYKKIYDVLRWNIKHGCDSITAINETIADGHYPELVNACEQRYHQEAAEGAERILARGEDVRIVIVAGPSSSGKTTSMIKVAERLRQAGKELVAINIDHYFFDLEMHPVDEFGDYDYETPQALDLELINRHLQALLAGDTIRTPHYDFKTGQRTLDVHELQLEPHQLLLIDSLHGLYDEMTSGVDHSHKFKLYVETLGQVQNDEGVFMRWADNRLMRRMMRDSLFRNLQPHGTLTHWHYVRASEMKNIIPFIDSVDFVLNSAMPYELPLLKQRLFDYFPKAMEMFKEHPKRQDAYLRARRVHDMIAPLTGIADDSPVPDDAIVREFIGGSRYDY